MLPSEFGKSPGIEDGLRFSNLQEGVVETIWTEYMTEPS